MATPPASNGQPTGRAGGQGGNPGSGFPAGKALIVLVAFVAATVLLLGAIHPKAATSASGVTTTTAPAHPTTTTSTIPPGKVPVLVANASGVAGAAAAVSNQLQPGGWNLLPPVNATARVTASHIYFVAGFQPQAMAIATQLHLSAAAVSPSTTADPISTIGTAEVLVVVGPDLATKAAPSGATTSTVN